MKPRSKLVSIPCPKCKQPNDFEAQKCSCGHSFIQESANAPTRLPALKLVLPQMMELPQAKARVPESEPEAVVEAKPQEAQEPPAAVPQTLLITNEPSQSEPSVKRRGLWVWGVAAVLLAFLAGFGISRFSAGESIPVQNAEAAPVGLTEQAVKSEDREPVSDIVSSPSATDGSPAENAAQPVDREEPGQALTTKNAAETRTSGQTEAGPNASGNETRTAAAKQPAADTANSSTTSQASPPVNSETVKATTAPATAKTRPVARCSDGTYSYSSVRSEVCAQRGGVAEWNSKTTPAQKNTDVRAYVTGPKGGCYYLTSSGAKVYVEKNFCN